jgi:hypothetical protein
MESLLAFEGLMFSYAVCRGVYQVGRRISRLRMFYDTSTWALAGVRNAATGTGPAEAHPTAARSEWVIVDDEGSSDSEDGDDVIIPARLARRLLGSAPQEVVAGTLNGDDVTFY